MSSIKNSCKWIFKSLLLIVGITMLVYAGIFFISAFQGHTKLTAMKQPLAQFPIDLSKPGQYSATLPAVEKYFHGLILMVDAKQQFSDVNTLEDLADGLAGHATIHKENGEIIGVISFSVCCPVGLQTPPDNVCFVIFDTFPEYEGQNSQLKITITQGAEKLKDIKQTLIARYHLCGLESTLVFFSTVFGIALTLFGLGITIPMSIHIIRQTKQKAHSKTEYLENTGTPEPTP